MRQLLTIAAVLLSSVVALANPEMTVDLPGGVTTKFVWIEPGPFLMGILDSESHPYAMGDWQPPHELT